MRQLCEEFHRAGREIGIVTALNPILGYERSASIAKEALASGRGVYELVLEKGWLTQVELDDLLSPEKMANPLMREPVE